MALGTRGKEPKEEERQKGGRDWCGQVSTCTAGLGASHCFLPGAPQGSPFLPPPVPDLGSFGSTSAE